MKFSKNEQMRIIEDFIGGRFIDEDTIDFLSDKFKKIDETIYRGMPFPKHLIKEDYIVEEWHGSSHWSLDFNVARDKFSIDDFNISDDYVEELSNELNLTYDEAYDLFVPIVLKIDGVSNGVNMYEVIKSIDENSRFLDEKEIVTMGLSFIMDKIESKTDENGLYYLISVKELEQ